MAKTDTKTSTKTSTKNKGILGIDIGGSGIKGAPVDIKTGELLAERHRIDTPQPSSPEAVANTIKELCTHFNWQAQPIGCTFPAIVRNGVTLSAANVDKAWIGCNAQALFEERTGCPVTVLNDADAAGVAEMYLGAGKDVKGVVLMLTFGTGIGSALFVDGHLVPNTELGHLDIGKHSNVESWTAARIRKEAKLSWKEWAKRVQTYLEHLDFIFSPTRIILGGGVSKKAEKWLPYIKESKKIKAELVVAKLMNEAGIVGAAMAAQQIK